MRSNGINGTHRPSRELLPAPRTKKRPWAARLRSWWARAWSPGGLLYGPWDDLARARHAGWHGMANWIKTVLTAMMVCSAIVVLDCTAHSTVELLDRLSAHAPPTGAPGIESVGGLWGVIDNPISSYIGHHSVGLSISGSAVHTAWQLTGLIGLVCGTAGLTAGRIIWLLWGTASIAMVWTASPDNNRTVATGLAILMWALASALPLRGLRTRPLVVHDHTHHPQIHLHSVNPPPPADTADDSGTGTPRQQSRR
ncbi:hypothetical protein AB0E08_47085 [Streptomyces sp. NPDC048281]|uniref:hypothetical protein n=1 Tax=Streptomyces sp. NPDC048281 TaxID=3154715 RepID=UPI003428E6CA